MDKFDIPVFTVGATRDSPKHPIASSAELAKQLNISRSAIYKKIERRGVNLDDVSIFLNGRRYFVAQQIAEMFGKAK